MQNYLEKISLTATRWVGTPASIVVHTLLFGGSFCLVFFGIPFDEILLVLTTIVSLEAIYLAIFIQMTVNRNTESLEDVEEEIEEIQEEMEEIGDDVEDISEEVEEISEDIDKIQEDKHSEHTNIEDIEQKLRSLLGDIESLRKKDGKS